MKNLYVLFVGALALALLQGGCGGGGGGGNATARLSITADFQSATRIVPGYADGLRVAVTPPTGVELPVDSPNLFLLTRTSTSFTLDGLAPSAQPYVLDMVALTDGEVVGTAQRSIIMTPGAVMEIDVSANLQSTVDSVTVEGVPTTTSGNSPLFTAVARNAQGSTLFSGAGFTWTSSKPGALSVDPDTGLATAIKSGTATISAALVGTSLSGQLEVRIDSGGDVSLTILSQWESATRDVPGYADELRVTIAAPVGVPLFVFPNPFVLSRAVQAHGLTGLMPDVNPYTVSMEALTDGVVVGTAVRNVVITQGEHLQVDVSANLESKVDSVVVEGISSMLSGDGTQFTAFAKDVLGATLFSGSGFTWASSKPAALSVDPDTGLATANMSGTATISATLSGTGVSGQWDVRVDSGGDISLTILSLWESATRDVPGYADELRVTVKAPEGVLLFITPNPFVLTRAAPVNALTGLMHDVEPYTVSMEALTDGVVVGTAARNVVITDGENMEIDVSANLDTSIASIEVEGASVLETGESSQFIAHAKDSQGTTLFSSPGFTFVSNNPSVLSIDLDTGLATANAGGIAIVVATLTGTSLSDQMGVTVGSASKITFTSRRDGNWEIYLMNDDGIGQTRLTDHSAFDGFSAFSPDGSKIAFHSNREGNREIFVMNPDGTGVTNLTNHASFDSYPAFSPTGSKIAFQSTRDGNGEIYVMNEDGTGQTRLTSNSAFDGFAAFSPDGSKIAFHSDRSGNWDIYVMNVDGSGLMQLTNDAAGSFYPAFSPDGSKIAFHSDRDGNTEIYVMNADGTGQTRVTNNTSSDNYPSFGGGG